MEVTYRTANGQLSANFDGKGQDDIFEQIASFQEVFETTNVIKGTEVPNCDVRFAVRTVGEDKYYEKRYVGPDKNLRGFKMEYHCKKAPKGALYVHTYLKSEEDKRDYEDGGNGWRRWKGERSAPAKSDNGNVPVGAGKDVPF